MKSLYTEQSSGNYGSFELEISVGATTLPDLEQDSIREAAYKASALIVHALWPLQ